MKHQKMMKSQNADADTQSNEYLHMERNVN